MSKSSGFLSGLISGVLIGSVVALLYAPDKGRNTRDKLSYRLNSYVDDLGDLIDRIKEESLTISDAKKEGDLVVEEAQKKAEELISEAEELLKNIGEK